MTGEVHVVTSEEDVELEEAFITTTSLPWDLHVGAQDLTREQMPSFQGEFEDRFEESVDGLERARTNEVDSLGDHGWLACWVNAWDFSPETIAQLGFSFLGGSNSTGSDGDTYIYGTDLKLTWLPTNNYRGWPFLTWQSEFAYRDYKVDEGNPNFDPDREATSGTLITT